ncbi:MAG: asparagine--tRNA ligase [Thermoplasmataceae archaeon]|jgi:asparaginyl-tRNA synthetase
MSYIRDVLNEEHDGSAVHLRGWVYRTRSSGKLSFIVLRDSTGIIQLLASTRKLQDDKYREISSLTIESSLEVMGILRKDDRAPTGYEVEIEDFKLYQRNENYPITKDQGEEFLLDNRHLWVRSREFTAMMKVRSTVFKAFADFYFKHGYYEVHTPFMVSTAAEGGSTLFKVPFFDEEVYLTQSSQFYLETMIFSLENVFTIAPSFRAEKSRTWRHLTEYWHGEVEAAWLHNEDMMQVEEQMIEYIVQEVVKNNTEELNALGRDVEFLKRIKAPFRRIRYADLIKMTESWGLGMKYGDDLGADEERAIMVHFDQPIFVTHYPSKLKTFYHMPDPDNPDEILCHDMLAPEGYGEIVGGGERISDLNLLEKRMEDYGLNKDNYYWYLDLRRYGSVPHSGFGLGLDRLVLWILHLDNIKEAIPFPRTIRRTKP